MEGKPLRVLRVVPAVLIAVVMLAGCSSAEPSETAESSSGVAPKATATPTGPEYTGVAIPGLGETPLWGVDANRQHVVFGDAITVWQPPGEIEDSGDDARFVADIHDLATGELRTTLDLNAGTGWPDRGDTEAFAGTWEGAPVLYYGYTLVTESDGLSSETTTRVVEAYDPRGELVGSYEQASDDGDFTVVDGWVLRTTEHGDAEITTVDGEVVVESVCGDKAGILNCSVDLHDNRVEFSSAQMRAIVNGLVFQSESRQSNGNVLVAHDPSTGEPAWTSDEIEAPEGVPPAVEVDGLNALPIAVVDGKLVLHWRHSAGVFDTKAPDTTVSFHDPATGDLLASGPTLPVFTGSAVDEGPSYLTDVDGTVAVLSSGASTRHATAIDPATGEVLWEQAEDEESLWPHAVVGGVLYGYRSMSHGDGSEPIAVDVATKEVLDAELTDVPVPAQLPGGNGLVSVSDGVFVFPAS